MTDGRGLLEPWIRLTRRRWRTGAALFAVVVLLGLGLLFLTRPVYRSEAALRLGEPPPAGGVNPSAGLLSFFQPGGDPFSNDLELLASRSVAEGVVQRMALTAALRAPRGWHRDSLLSMLRTSRETEEARFRFRWLADDQVEVRRTAPTDSVIGRVAPGVPITFGGITIGFRPRRDTTPETMALETVRFRTATRRVRSALDVQRPSREANVVILRYDHPDPGVADGVVAAAVAEFVRLRTELQHRESTQAADSLRGVAAETRRELREAEDSLESLQRTRRLFEPSVQSEALVERRAELEVALDRGRSELEAVDRMLARLDSIDEPSTSWTALMSLPAFLQSGTVGSMLTRLTELHARRQDLATRRAPDNAELQLLDERIAYLDSSLRRVARQYRAGLVDQVDAVRPQVAELDAALASLPAGALEMARRERDVRLLSEVLLLTEQRLRQEELREALAYANVQIVDPPALRDRPVWPRKKLGLLVVLLVASASGVLGMVVRDRTDPRIRSARELEAELGRPPVAVIGPAANGGLALDATELELVARRTDGAKHGLNLVPVDGAPPVTASDPSPIALRSRPPLHAFRDAATLASEDAPTVLVVEAGQTTRAELRRARRWIEDAGGTVAGAILVCTTERAARVVWG